VIILNCVVKSFVERIREKLGKLDFDRKRDVDEAANALPLGDRFDVSRDQDSVVQRLETGVNVQVRTLTHADYGVTHVVVDRHIDGLLAHLAGAVNDVDNRHGVRSFAEVWHEGRVYPTASRPAGPVILSAQRTRQDVGMITEHATLPVIPGREQEFEAAFASAKRLISASPGFRSLSLSRCIERPSAYLLLVEWDSIRNHEVGFRGSPAYDVWRAELHHFYSPPATVEHYAVVTTA
jgi:heme-degrading monooxygenase HmoA